jgi:ABC-type lipoprotein export system ATPase subunit
MVAVSQLRYSYSGSKQLAFPDFTLNTGEHAVLLGESGCGKTTLLHLLGGLLPVSHGSIQIDAQNLTSISASKLDLFRGQKIGFIFQRNHLLPALTVKENLLLAPYLANVKPSAAAIESLLNTLGLSEMTHARIATLSQGQRQRVAIARAVMNKPAVLLADEPTAALDDKHCNIVMDLLTETAHQTQACLLVATHDHRVKSIIKTVVQL